VQLDLEACLGATDNIISGGCDGGCDRPDGHISYCPTCEFCWDNKRLTEGIDRGTRKLTLALLVRSKILFRHHQTKFNNNACLSKTRIQPSLESTAATIVFLSFKTMEDMQNFLMPQLPNGCVRLSGFLSREWMSLGIGELQALYPSLGRPAQEKVLSSSF
jgi:hypothetical protein